jgi:amidase
MRSALLRAGHQVIDIEPFDGKELADAAYRVLLATGGEEVTKLLSILNETLIKEVSMPDPPTKIPVIEYHECAVKIKQLRQKDMDIWQATAGHTETGLPIDAIILPSGGTGAPPHRTMEYFTYEGISNILEWTCATVPVTVVDPLQDPKPTSFEPMSEDDRRNWEKCEWIYWVSFGYLLTVLICTADTPDYYKEAPVCLQVMGRRYEEEKVLGLLRTIDEALGRGGYYMA